MKPTAFLDGTFDDSDLSDNCDIKLNPKLNVDGGMSFDSDSEEEAPKKESKKKRPRILDSGSEEEQGDSKRKLQNAAPKRRKGYKSDDLDLGDSDTSLPEIRA